jgi:hypothetical protein
MSMGWTIALLVPAIPTFLRTEVLVGPCKPNAEAQQKVASTRVAEATFMVNKQVQLKNVSYCLRLAVGGWRLMLSNAGRWYRYIDTRLPGVTSGCQKKKRHFEIAS